MQDKLFKDSKKETTDVQLNSTQKEYFIKRRKSSDLTSVSLCPTDDISITSENFFIQNESKQSSYINDSNEIMEKPDENVLGYFYGIEKYFRMMSPEKFHEYKKTRNYLPKRGTPKKEEPKKEIIEEPINIEINEQENAKSNIYPQVPVFCFPVYGNVFYYNYMYNNFFFNNINATQVKHYNISKKESIEEVKDIDTTSKPEEEEKRIEIKKDDDIEIINKKKYSNKNESDYFGKNKKHQYYNKNQYYKYEDNTYNYKDKHYYNKNIYGNENTYRRNPNTNKYSNNYNEDYKKYNGYNGRRWNKYYYENNFQRKKYYN